VLVQCAALWRIWSWTIAVVKFSQSPPTQLKTLVLKKCQFRNLSEILSPTLKTLVIDGGSNTDDCVLVIMAPSVAYLHLAMRIAHFSGGV
jgi:hypothetical protein